MHIYLVQCPVLVIAILIYIVSHKLPFGISSISWDKPFHVLYTDVWGLALVESFNHFWYYVVFVDYFTKYSWLYLTKHKYDAISIFKRFKIVVENLFDYKIATIYSDGGEEYQGLTSTLT